MLIAKCEKGFESLFNNADAQKVADEIISIGNSATPHEILDKARDENTELHKCFTWNDRSAAEKWRLHEARQIVCHLVIDRRDGSADGAEKIRYFYKTSANEGYKRTDLIYNNEGERSLLLKRALSELIPFKRTYEMLDELSPVIMAINQVLAESHS